MANKPFIYEIEDTETGTIYEIEGPEGATPEELGAFISSQNQAPVDAPLSSPEQTQPSVQVDQGVGGQAPAMIQQEQETVNIRSAQKGANPEWMDPEAKATVDEMMKTRPREEVEAFINTHAKEKGLIEVGLGGTQEDYDKYQQAVAEGAAPMATGYERISLTDLGLNEAEPVEAPAEGEMGWIDQLTSAVSQSAQEGFGGVVARNIYDLMDTGQDEIRKLYPDISDEQLEELTDYVVATAQKDLIAANEIKNRNSDWLPWLTGSLLGSGSPIDAVIPGGGKFITKVASAGVGNVVEDVAIQGANVYQGVQDEYSPEQTAMAGGLGAVLGAGIHVAGAVGGKLLPSREAPAAPRPEGEPYITAPTGRKNSKAYKAGMVEAVQGGTDKVAELTQGWVDAPNIVVVDTFRKTPGVENEALGVIQEDGSILLNMEEILLEAKDFGKTPDEVITALTFHEGLGHYGLSKKFGSELDLNLERWYDEGTSGFREDVDVWVKNHPDAYKGRPDQLVRAAEEVIVEWSEKGQMPASMYNQLINMLKQFGRDIGIQNIKYSKRELETFLGLAHKKVVKGDSKNPFGGSSTKYASAWREPFDEVPTNTTGKYSMQEDLTRAIRKASNPRAVKQQQELQRKSKQILDEFWTRKRMEENNVSPYEEWENKAATGKYMYAGRKSKLTNVENLEQAMGLEDAGWEKETIRDATGWRMEGDGQWRYEINDSDMALVDTFTLLEDTMADFGEMPDGAESFLKFGSVMEALADKKWRKEGGVNAFDLDSLIVHPELFEAYPFLEGLKVTRDQPVFDPKKEVNGFYQPGYTETDGTVMESFIYINPDLDSKAASSTLLHEIQHAVQEFEGFARGGNTESVLKVMPSKTIIANSGTYYNTLIRDAEALEMEAAAMKRYVNDPDIVRIRELHKQWTDALIAESEAPMDGSLEATIKRSDLEALYMEAEGDLTEKLGFGRDPEDMSDINIAQFSKIINTLVLPQSKPEVYTAIRKIDLKATAARMSAKRLRYFIDSRNVSGIKQILAKDYGARFEAYRHVFGEVEARDTQYRFELGMSDRDRSLVEPYSLEEEIDPDNYIFDMDMYPNQFNSESRPFKKAYDPVSGGRFSANDTEAVFQYQKNGRPKWPDEMMGTKDKARFYDELAAYYKRRAGKYLGNNQKIHENALKSMERAREDARKARADSLAYPKDRETRSARRGVSKTVADTDSYEIGTPANDKYSRRKSRDVPPDLTDDEIPYTPQASKAFLDDLVKNYEAPKRGWNESKAEARRSGMTAKQIRTAKSVGELDKKLFQYEAVAQKTDGIIAKLNEKLGGPKWTLADKQKYMEAIYSQTELLGRIFDDQGEVGRALNAVKALSFTKRNLAMLNQTLQDFEGDSGIAAFASDDIFNEFAAKVKYMMENGNPQGARSMMQSVIKPYWWQYILSFRHAMMLSGLGTQAKNITDNGLMLIREAEEAAIGMLAFPVRKAIRATGKALPWDTKAENLVDGVSPQEVAARVYGIVSAAFDMATYKDSWEALKKGHGNSQVSSKVEMQDAHIPGVSKVTDFLHAADIFFRAFHDNANLYTLGVRQARDQGFTGVAAFQEGTNLAHTPDVNMLREAKQLTDTALLVDTPSQLGQMIEAGKSIRPGMSGGRQAFSFAMNLAAPFLRVTDRLIFQKIRRSPFAFLDKNTRKEIMEGGPKMDIAIGRALFGSYLIAQYWEAAGEGEVVGEGPSNYQKREALEGGGWMQNSVIEGEKYVDAMALNLSLLPSDLHNATAANVASIREAYEKGEDVTGSLALAFKSLTASLAGESFANSLEPYVAAFDKKDEEGVQGANAVGSLASQFVPAAARQLNQQLLDPIKRNTTGDRSFEDRVAGRVMSGIPGLSQKLPAKYDVYGDVKTQGRSTLAMSNYREIKSDDVAKELFRLEKASKDTLISPTKGSFKSIDAIGADLNKVYVADVDDKGQIKLTGVGREELQRVQGYWVRQWMAEEMSYPEYNSMSDEEKFDLAKEIRKDAAEAAKEHMLPLIGLGEDAGFEEDG